MIWGIARTLFLAAGLTLAYNLPHPLDMGGTAIAMLVWVVTYWMQEDYEKSRHTLETGEQPPVT